MEHQHYEFDNSQNALIKQLAEKMNFVSYFLIVTGVLATIGGLFSFQDGGLSSIVSGITQIIIGALTIKAAASFKLIVDTQGNDMENLMGALGELRKLYALQYWLLIISLIFGAIVLVLSLVVGFG